MYANDGGSCRYAAFIPSVHTKTGDSFMMFKNIFAADGNAPRPKLIQYSFPNNTELVHKESGYPILQDSQLIVGPNQTVIMVRNGQICHRYEAGAQVLDTGMLRSVLKAYEKTYEGGENGVPVDLYFINNLYSDVLPWGTPSPIQIIDPVLDILIKISANGQLRYQIVDPELYILTNLSSNVADLNRICKQKALASFSAAIQSYVRNEKLGFFELSAETVKLSERLKDLLNAKLVGEEGFRITEFTIAAFHASDEDLATLQNMKNDVMRMKKEAEARAYARSVEGYTYQEERRFDVMQDAASNTGSMGGVMGAVTGAAMGMGLGQMIGGNVTQAAMTPAARSCTSCGASLAEGAKFCAQCGTPVAPAEKFCIGCGHKLPADAKFCPGCGAKQP